RMEEGTGMTTAQVGYEPVHRWVKHILGRTHTTVVVTVTWAVLCLLVAQRVTSAALARALPAEQAGSGRSCLRRGRGRGGGAGAGAARVERAGARPSLHQPDVDPPRPDPRANGPTGGSGVGHHPPGPLGSLAGWHRRCWPHAADWLGRHPISLAQGALPGHDVGGHPPTPAGLPGRGLLDVGGGSWLSERHTLCPVTPGWHGLQRAVAPERLGDRGGGLCDGQCASGGWAVGRRAADGRDDRAWHPGAALGPGCHRRERRGGGAAAP